MEIKEVFKSKKTRYEADIKKFQDEVQVNVVNALERYQEDAIKAGVSLMIIAELESIVINVSSMALAIDEVSDCIEYHRRAWRNLSLMNSTSMIENTIRLYEYEAGMDLLFGKNHCTDLNDIVEAMVWQLKKDRADLEVL